MLIISQNREELFDMTEIMLKIIPDYKGDNTSGKLKIIETGMYWIMSDKSRLRENALGLYSSEEKAKEVLLQITENYEDGEKVFQMPQDDEV